MTEIRYVEVNPPISPDEVIELLNHITNLEKTGERQLVKVLKEYLYNEVENCNQVTVLLSNGCVIAEFETVLDVAEKLGFVVPDNYVERLIDYVRNNNPDLFITSLSPITEVPDDAVIAGHQEIETNVRTFCVRYSFLNNKMV